MAPTVTAAASTPGRAATRQNVYFQPGVQGRKTGITLKDTGRRDEHGFEPLDDIFSSPEKSPVKCAPNGIRATSSGLNEQQQEPVLEPASARRLTRSARVSLPPPKGRSPIKTHLNSSPVRHPSLAPKSEARSSIGSPIRPAQLGSVKRRIDFNQAGLVNSIEISPKRAAPNRGSSDAENVPPQDEGLDVASALGDAGGHDYMEDAYAPVVDDDSLQMVDTYPSIQEATPLQSIPRPMETTRKQSESAEPATLKRKRGRPKGSSKKTTTSHPSGSVLDANDQSARDESSLLANGASDEAFSANQNRSFSVHHDEDDSTMRPPTKKARGGAGKTQTKGKAARSAKSNSKAPSERDPNARPADRQRSASKAPSDSGSAAPARNSRAPSKPRSLQILRQGTPLEEPGATTTRSGRQSIQPVAWWVGERINRDYDGTIKDVIRAEMVDLTPKRKGRRPGRPKRKAMDAINEEEEEPDLEPWEEGGGILTGLVKAWDSEYNMTLEDDDVEMEIAFAANSIQTRDVMGANFSYAKLLSLPFFGAGVVDLPPGGFKRAKNSRKMQMIFFVHTGKVLVTVGDLEFSISKGGAWQVPRGNFYSIENKGEVAARVFFSQGYEQVAEAEFEAE